VAAGHMRSEDDDRVEASIREHVEASRPARTHVSHLKVVYGEGVERAERLLQALEEYRRAGVELTADAYPYTASYTGVGILFPEWAMPPTDYAEVLAARRGGLAAGAPRASGPAEGASRRWGAAGCGGGGGGGGGAGRAGRGGGAGGVGGGRAGGQAREG